MDGFTLSPTKGPANQDAMATLTPPAPPTNVRFTRISAGDNHSLALDSNGNTYAWGQNYYGKLGDGTTITQRNQPVRVHAPAGVTFTQISAGWGHSMAIGSDNYTYAWGYNNEGELGDGTPNLRSTPVRVSTPAGVRFTRISAGYWHSLAIGSDGNTYTYGSAYAWGNNSEGELGHGTGGNQHTPAPVSTPSSGNPTNTWKTISAGNSHSLALDSDGHAYAWGYNRFGQLGDGTTNDHSKPAPVLTPRYVIDGVAFGGASVTSKTVNATTGAWDMHVPQHTPGAVDVTVAYHLDGLDVNGNIANPRYQSGTVTLRYTYATPYTVSFQLGGAPGTPPASQYSYPDDPQPINWPVPDPVWAGHWFDGWAKPDGSPWDFTQPVRNDLTLTATWRTPRFTMTPTRGPDTGGTTVHITPPDPPQPLRFTQISAGSFHSLAIGTDGNTYAWGYNFNGQLGDGTRASRSAPVRVSTPPGVRFTAVSAGGYHSLAISSDGRLYSWGSNSNGQLGDGGSSDRNTPAPVNPATDNTATWKTISAGGYHNLALRADGHAYSWGANTHGQLGDGANDPNPHSTPAPVNPAADNTATWKTISAGDSHNLALNRDGHAYNWGADNNGQLGDDNTTDQRQPTPASPAADNTDTWTAISAGGYHSLALNRDGHAYNWGANGYGQLGDTTTTERHTPTPTTRAITITGTTFEPTNAPTPTWNPTTHTWDTTSPTHPEGQATVTIHWTLDGATQPNHTLTYDYTHYYTLPKAGGAPTQQLAGATLLTLTTLTALTLTSHHITRKHHHTNQPTTTTSSK
ncbi:hypothetical protein AB656_00245 [Bifidobacterium actinocoloniiforme DSM 22766]|nr:hypothetical protein AB656_00245 [Bifidobacterium actinocoloniiforme DSM 22766]